MAASPSQPPAAHSSIWVSLAQPGEPGPARVCSQLLVTAGHVPSDASGNVQMAGETSLKIIRDYQGRPLLPSRLLSLELVSMAAGAPAFARD